MEGGDAKAMKTVIGEDVEIVGSVKCTSSIQIDGKLNGDLTCKGSAVVGPSANVKGNLNVESVTIHGHVTGNVEAKDRIALKATANLSGDIRGKRLSVEDGVTFVGKSEVNPQGPGARAAESGRGADSGGEQPDQEDAKGKQGGFGKK